MTDTAISPVRSFRPQPFVPVQVARRIQPVEPGQLTEPERRRLARELHDGPVQEVLAAGLAIGSCLAELDAESSLRPGLEQARRLTATALRQLRSVLQSLRDGTDAPDAELPDMLRRLGNGHPACRLDVSVEVTGPPLPLAATICRFLFQMASECVFNAAVHGRARRAVIRLSYGSGTVVLRVADDGCGKPKTLRRIIRGEVPGTGGGYHLGLTDIAALAEEMGWTLRADRSNLGGIAVQVTVPAPTRGDRPGGTDE
jgi:signal transduction histidine kinase